MSRTVQILTPDNVEIEYKLAGVGVRAAAAGIDLLIQGALLILPACFLGWYLYSSGPTQTAVMTALGIFILISGVVNYGYFIFSDMVMKGQTPGKRLYHIRVIRDNGEGITPSHAMIREFLRATIDPLGVGFIMIFLNKRNKRLGDLMASTIVVEEERNALEGLEALYKPNRPYPLTERELEILQDYVLRADEMDPMAKYALESKLSSYFKRKLGITDDIINKEAFLRGLL